MNRMTNQAGVLDLGRLGVQPLADEELLLISGGGPIAVGCLLAVGGTALAITGVVVGVIVYAIVAAGDE